MEVMDAGETVDAGDQVVVGSPNGGGIDQLFGGFTPRPWQTRAVLAAIQRLSRQDSEPFVVGGPTGSGKSLTMTALLRWCVQNGGRAALYSNRRLLTNQLITGLQSHGLKIGVRAADFDGHEDASAPIQICSLQTEMSRVFKRRKKAVEDGESEERARLMYPLEQVDLVLIDEVHMQAAASAEAVIAEYRENGAKVVGFTATPTDLSHIFSELIEAGTVKECLAHKALVPAHVYSCEELDTRHIKPQATGEYSIKEIEKKIWTPQIFGYVWHHWRRLNPHGRQTLGFAPGVSHSVWFAELFSDPANYPQKAEWLARQRESLQWSDAMCEEFMRHGVRAAHIDGADVWVDGKRFKTTPQARADVMGEWKDGKISVVWNRFVLREAIDMPSLYHLILACPIGSVVSYVQVVGRVMRWSKETPDAVLITDHGGNAWRHGSPNEDRDWSKFWHLPSSAMTDERMESMRNKSKPEPITCPRCRAVRRSGTKCWKCGYEHQKSSRLVLEVSGELREFMGSTLRPHNVQKRSNTQKLWDDIYFQAYQAHRKLEARVAKLEVEVQANPGLRPTLESSRELLATKLSRAQTFRQAYARFFLDHHYYPPKDLANMPRDPLDWYRKIRDLERSNVRTQAEAVAAAQQAAASAEKPVV